MATYFLSERKTQPLVVPLGLSGRIKYTCVALSASYLALGANTGGVYCFHRDNSYIQLLANKEGAVSVVKFSPDEQLLGVVAGGGYLVIWELRLSGSGVCKRLHVSSLLKDAVIRDLVWEAKKGRVYFGDSNGRVAVASLPKAAMKSNLFRRANEVIFQEKSAIVQLDLHGDMLLVSTQSRAVLLMLTSVNRTAVQVGKKSRDGSFGACFDVRERDRQLVVYSARPGGRLWEAGVKGDVQSTVKMKELFTLPPTTIVGHGSDPKLPSPPSHPPTLTPHYLHSPHNGKYFVSWDDSGLYLWQPSTWQLTAWTNGFSGMVGVACEEGRGDSVTLCALVEEGRKVWMVTTATLLTCIQFLLQDNLLDQVTKLVVGNMREVIDLLTSHPPSLTTLTDIIPHNLTLSPSSPLALQLLCLQSIIEDMSHPPPPDHTPPPPDHTHPPPGHTHSPPGHTPPPLLEQVATATSQPHGQSHDDDDVVLQSRPARDHRRSNSWSGVPQHLLSTESENVFQPDDEEEVWSLSGSHTPSNPSLSREESQDPFSMETPSLESSTEHTGVTPPSGGSPRQPSSVEAQSPPDYQGVGLKVWSEEPRPHRSQSLQLVWPPQIAMATLLDHDSDDVIAVPVRSLSMAVSVGGGKTRSKKKSRHSKKAASSSSSLPTPSITSSVRITTSHGCLSQETGVGGEDSLNLIPEEAMLPFPDAGLPSDVGAGPNSALLQRGSGIVAKMKELAKQGGQSMETAQPVRRVRELLSSLAAPVPTALSIPASVPQTVFVNEDYITPQPLPDPTTGVDQSDHDPQSHDLSPTQREKSQLALITMETQNLLAMPHVYCSAQAIQSALSDWLVVMETTEDPTQSVKENVVVDLLTLALEVGVFGCESGLIPFLRRHSKLLHGPRSLRVLGGVREWRVRGEGWRLLTSGGRRQGGDPSKVVMEMTNQNAGAADLPTYLTSLLTSDPSSLVAVCVKSWPVVQPWQVALVCSTDQSDDSPESHDSLSTYASYMSQLLGSSEGVREEVGCDEVMVLASLEMFLRDAPSTDQLVDDEGRPRGWSHHASWPHLSLIMQLVDMCATMTTDHLTEAVSVCERHGYWLGVIQLAAAAGDKGKSLLIIMRLRDSGLLKDTQKWGRLVESVADWQKALETMSEVYGPVTGHVTGHVREGELTMSELVHVMVERVGPTLATHILASVGGAGGVASGEAGAELHSLLVQLAALHAQQRRVARGLLEKVDRYLWSRQPVAVCPELQEIEERERERRRAGEETGLDVFQTDMDWRQTLEDSSRHWGVRVRGGGDGGKGLCGVCSSSLSLTVSAQQPGLVLFQCGHAYHQHCIPEMACYVCFKKHSST